MRKSCGALALVALLDLTCGGVAAAQSLVVRNATPGSNIDLVANTSPAGSAVADAIGDATLPVPLLSVGQRETVARVLVDVCGDRTQVIVVESARTPPPAVPGCSRHEVEGQFVVRSVTSIAVDLSGSVPIVRIRQGPVPDAWFRPQLQIPGVRAWDVPAGFVVSASAAMTALPRASDIECGIVRPCNSQTRQGAYAGGAAYWFTPNFGAGVQYMRPGTITISGGPVDESYRFDTRLRTEDVASASAMAGLPLGRVRAYGLAGLNRHRATAWMTQTVSEFTVEIDDEPVVFPGGSQTVVRRTAGIGWLAGGGAEFWTGPRLAVYTEGGVHILKGSDVEDGGPFRSDGRMAFLQFGARFRLW